MNRLPQLAEILKDTQSSCVISSHGETLVGLRRGVLDLYFFVNSDSDVLRDSAVADKVVGKGAAALLVIGGATAVYANLISEPALQMLRDNNVNVQYGTLVPHILNRDRSGYCPLETACMPYATAQECMPAIETFVTQILNKPKP